MNDVRAAAQTEPTSLRLVATLAVAGLVSGLAIIGIYEATLATITANKARELRAAVFEVLPDATRMQALVWRGDRLEVPEGTQEVQKQQDEPIVYGGYGDDGFVGYAIPGAGPGFQDTIKLIFGYEPATRHVVGMWVLESRETPGLGDKIYKDPSFVASFRRLSIDPEIVAVKKGRKVAANEVDAITGATISSKAVVEIINAANQEWLERLPDPGAEPEYIERPASTEAEER